MKQTKLLLLAFSAILLSGLLVNAQTIWINGFNSRLAGENLDYHSCHPDANLALLVRCLNDKDYIEWKTDSVSPKSKNRFISFAWIAGYSVGTSTAPHKFFLYLNDKLRFKFTTKPHQPQKDWQINSKDGSSLYFKFIKVDAVDDFFGYMILTVPKTLLNGNGFARIKVKGDATNSKDWYMTMQYPLIPKIRISPERIVSKNSAGQLMQRVKVSIDHFDSPKPVTISSGGKEILSSELKLGMNNYFLNFAAPKSPKEINLEININGKTSKYKTVMKPAKIITFYLIPHAHVDIGYTDLQPNVEKKHWNNYDRAIELSKESANLGSDATFKWNVEALWAVNGYLKNFPEKRKIFFNAVRKGWIGLDADYGNVLTGLCRPEELYHLVEYSNELEKKIGIKIESSMISDVPGYTWGIVQALADNGIKYFSVGPNTFDRIGYTLKTWGDKPFYWKSQSGKEKILVWVAGKGYSWFHQWRLTRDDFSPIAKYLDELADEKYPYDMVHLRYNIGGDNGFPDSSLSKFVKQWNNSHITPKFKIATNEEMFKDFEAKYSKLIPTYSGDFTPYWEDGAASTAKETAINRNTAELLTQLEIMHTLFNRSNYPQKEFEEAWRYVLLFSEHTWGAWNSISDPDSKSVIEQWEIKKSYAVKADSLAHDLLNKLSYKSEKTPDHFYVCNSSSWKRSDIVLLPASVNSSGICLTDMNGTLIPVQRLSTGNYVFTAKDIPGLGFKEYKIVECKNQKENSSPLVGNTMLNNFYNLSFDKKTFAIENLNRIGNDFNYVSSTDVYKLNQFIHTGQNAADPVTNNNPELISYENGPVLKSITLKSSAAGCSELLQKIVLFNDLDKIELVNTVDKTKDYHKESIRFAFPMNISDPVSRINIAWSVIRPEKDQLPGSNKNYFTSQRWVDVSNNMKGLTISSVGAPLFEFGGMNAEAWMSSPDKDWAWKTASSSLCYSWAMNNSWHTNFKASQEGIVSFRYFLRAHNHFGFLQTYKFGVDNSQPLLVLYSDNVIKNYSPVVKLDSTSSLVITAVYASKDGRGVMVRIFNPTEKTGFSGLEFKNNTDIKCYLSNGDEEEIKKINDKITLSPFEVSTLKIVDN